MMRFSVILLCIVGVIAEEAPSDEFPEVTAPTGRIRGSTMTSRLGNKIYSFRSVRYAEPPTGELRFEPPVPVRHFEEVYDATQEGPGCSRLAGTPISEDCLRLNVYTTKLPCENEDVKRPVMVFFHPGGYYAFSGQSTYFGPHYLMDTDIVLVIVNYRLGTLGFLSTGDSLAPGNQGMKDQVVALRWVQRNIAAFGGDPDSVTISGYSVGGISVMLHMVSPMSRNLFHRAISMSGSAKRVEPYPTEQKDIAKKQAQLLGCPTDSSESIIKCLRTKPLKNFTDTMPLFFEWNGNPMMIWSPVVEPVVPGVENFLPAEPFHYFNTGNFHQVPYIGGVTEDELSSVVIHAEMRLRNGNDSVYRDLDQEWERLAPIIFNYQRNSPRSRYISNELRRFYFKDQPIGPETSKDLELIISDGIINYNMYSAFELITKKSSQPTYFYNFAYQGRYSFVMWNKTTPYGVLHHDDLQYLFTMEVLFPFINQTSPEAPMVDLYTAMWSNFVKTGEPVSKSNELLKDITWERFSPEKNNYLEIDLHPTMKTDLFGDRLSVWERLFTPAQPLK